MIEISLYVYCLKSHLSSLFPLCAISLFLSSPKQDFSHLVTWIKLHSCSYAGLRLLNCLRPIFLSTPPSHLLIPVSCVAGLWPYLCSTPIHSAPFKRPDETAFIFHFSPQESSVFPYSVALRTPQTQHSRPFKTWLYSDKPNSVCVMWTVLKPHMMWTSAYKSKEIKKRYSIGLCTTKNKGQNKT